MVGINLINNNLYSAAIEAGIEPNIIIEFARIYGFEIDFQRDIRKGDAFEIYYEKFLDDNNVVRDTGKIIFAHMNVNNREINLYNFKDDDGEWNDEQCLGQGHILKWVMTGSKVHSLCTLSCSYGQNIKIRTRSTI